MDAWVVTEKTITNPSLLERLAQMMAESSDVIVEHRFYRRSTAPYRFVCGNIDEFKEYLRTKAFPGDSFCCWAFEECCRDDNMILSAKMPNEKGETPVGGAY